MVVQTDEVVTLTPPTKKHGWLSNYLSPTTVNRLKHAVPYQTPTCEWGAGIHQCQADAVLNYSTTDTQTYLCSVHAFEPDYMGLTSNHTGTIQPLTNNSTNSEDKINYQTDWVECPDCSLIHPQQDPVRIIKHLHQSHDYTIDTAVQKTGEITGKTFKY